MAGISTPRQERVDNLESVKRNRAAIAGERAVKAATTEFLPPLASMCCTTRYDEAGDYKGLDYYSSLTLEGKAAYNKYIANAYFYAAAQRTLSGLVGLIFSKKAVTEFSTKTEYLIDNADGRGNSLRSLSKLACSEAEITPWSGILVARPSTPEGATEADVEAMNIRPKLLHYKFEDIISWDYEVINNEEKLSYLVLRETISVRDEFEVKQESQYRHLQLVDGVYHQALYNDAEEVIETLSPVIINNTPATEIPFYWIDAQDGKGSPFDGLVDANFQHYNLYADYGGKLHYSSFIIYTETGAEQGTNNLIGNGVKWNNGSSEATFGMLQPDGSTDGHRLELQSMEERMAALGAEQLKPRIASAESAEAKSLDQVAQNSTTADVAITVSDAIQKASNFADVWQGGAGDNTYKLNTDYNPTGMDHNMITAQLNLVQAGKLTDEQFYSNLQQGEVANADVSFEQSQEKLQVQDTGME